MGDFEGNFQKISNAIKKASGNKCDIIVFPEYALTGCPPEDLLLKPAFLDANEKYLEKIMELSDKLIIICGSLKRSKGLFNTAYVFSDRKIIHACDKQNFSDCHAFDEKNYLQKGSGPLNFNINGLNICLCHYEDLYLDKDRAGARALLSEAKLVIVIAASPYYLGRPLATEKLLAGISADFNTFMLYVNLAGGQDELVFDGNSIMTDGYKNILARGNPFEEDLFFYETDFKKLKKESAEEIKKKVTCKTGNMTYKDLVSSSEEEIFKALVLGTRDYISKNGFTRAVLGLSGGIDSAICAVIAAFALGSENVIGILMPSQFSSGSSIDDALALAGNLKIRHIEIPITNLYQSYIDTLAEVLKTKEINPTKENIQARIRGNILMALSNEFDWFVLVTGNKSETSVGYSTLYGDMAGGLSPIKDVYKTVVYRLCNFINKKFNNLIPENTLLKEPSAELKPDQKDLDSLPPYDELDAILKLYLEDNKDYEEITAATGFCKTTVKKVIRLIDINEYKRRQDPPGIRITENTVKKDRKFPMTNKFKY